MTLENFWLSQNWSLLERVNGWRVERAGDQVILTIPARDGDQFRVLCICNDYPATAPSVRFINGDKNPLDKKAWPRGTREFMQIVKLPPNCFLCTSLTREGLQHHNDWRTQPHSWNGSKHTLIDVFNLLHRLLNSPQYLGRGD